MAITITNSRPSMADYTPLAQYQASTPASYSLDENPILHFSYAGAGLTSSLDLPTHPTIISKTSTATDIYVLNTDLVFWFPNQECGLSVSYPDIILHAIQTQQSPSIYLQINFQLGFQGSITESDLTDDYDNPILELTITMSPEDQLRKLYSALSHCASLHPDFDSDDQEQGAGDESDSYYDNLEDEDAFPEDHQWITAENIDSMEFGNHASAALEVVLDEPIKTGIVRRRESIEAEADQEAGYDDSNNAFNQKDDTVKWRRME
ncbi:hypothetical protein NADFUDRAFT_52765 [Nadsonia fulvescens var. elongata DSM 6958]|uniref:Protein LOT5 n=1 Tax=Nadsonia fulvescens var. elongata DSM 6958 TaxID=857566 RepID=A0A1E3PGB0_9ASCO|nr:hypothetical protein NADFUDRAFT_52765 [Nadsonia fulvescens var. elongata DSM 6958]